MISYLGWHTLTVIDQILESPRSPISSDSAVSLCGIVAEGRLDPTPN